MRRTLHQESSVFIFIDIVSFGCHQFCFYQAARIESCHSPIDLLQGNENDANDQSCQEEVAAAD
jgi:hypothetical protein